MATGIEWTDETWNPIVGCSVVSPGCTNCYAMKMAHRLEAMGVEAYRGLTTKTKAGAVWNGKVRVVEDALTLPLRWKKPRRIFVNSMSDLFHPDVPDAAIDRVFAVMALCPQHTFQLLTKRPERMRAYLGKPGSPAKTARFHAIKAAVEGLGGEMPSGFWFRQNIWLGFSAEDQPRFDERWGVMKHVSSFGPKWASLEPLLGPIDLNVNLDWCDLCGGTGILARWPKGKCHVCNGRGRVPIMGPRLPTHYPRLDWLVVGGESGPGARPMHPQWVRSLRDQCAAAGVPFLFKQWGEACPLRPELIPVPHRNIGWVSQSGDHIWNAKDRDYARMNRGGVPGLGGHTPWWSQVVRVGKKAAGRLLDGQLHDAYPEARS